MKHIEDFDTVGGVLGTLHGGVMVRTTVPGGEGPPYYGRGVLLHRGDTYCDDCREHIDPDEWYREAWANVLARQKVKHGGTWCGDCFASRGDQTEDSDEQDRPGRQFD